jgi:endonuclease/exonuclease/phosphatase family metal-dependent hydrolase
VRVISWNLFHGRALPEQRRYLYDEFETLIDGWDWDVLLLQEAPPWWPAKFAARFEADHRMVKTSRNFGLALRRQVATRRPDLIKSNGGGANAILVRGRRITEHQAARIRLVPERRLLHAVGCDDGLWIANLHMQGTHDNILKAPNPIAETRRTGELARQWAGAATAIVLGGDFNVPEPELAGFERVPGHRGVDQIFVRNLRFDGHVRTLDRGTLSDHKPIVVNVVT